MKQFFYLSALSILALTSCNSEYKKSEKGIQYKIITDGSGNKVAYGNFLQMQVKQMYKNENVDTLLSDSREIMPQVESYDSMAYPSPFFKIFGQLRKGDSLVLRLASDSILKDAPPAGPTQFLKKGGYLYTTIKITNIFTTAAQADSSKSAEMTIARPKIYKKQISEIEKILVKNKVQLDKDDKIISDYLAKNSIVATKAPWGTYVAMHTEGTGNKVDNNTVITVNYTGRTLDSGKVFDSNVDPKFNHVQPYQLNLGQLGGVILGWTDGLMQLKKGSKATLYIPSSLGYGTSGNPQGGILPDANLVFDIDVVDAASLDVFNAQAEEMRKKMEQAQKANPDTAQHNRHN